MKDLQRSKTMKTKTLDNKSECPNPKNIKLGKVIAVTMVKTLAILAFVLGFIVVSMSAIFPKTTLKAFDAVGLDKSAYLVQKRLYQRVGSNENLYNLIQRAIEQENYDDQIEYIKIMLESDDYVKFSETVDSETKELLGQRYSVYIDSYDVYLRRHLVIALYNSSRELEAKMMAIDSVYAELDELYVYVNLIVNDNELTELQKEIELTTFYNGYSIIESIEREITELKESLGMISSDYDKIIVLEQLVKLSEIQITLGEYANKPALKEEATLNKEEYTSKISELVNNLN